MEVVLKMDDLEPETVDSFCRVYDIVKNYNATASFGVIGAGLERGNQKYIRKLQDLHNNGIELWNHGYSHEKTEFSFNDPEQQRESIERTQEAFQKRLGFKPNVFGSPYNNSKETTVNVLARCFPEIENYYFMADGCSVSKARQILLRCNYEKMTGVVDYAYFCTEYKRMETQPYIVLQGHPAKWNEESFYLFERIIRELRGYDCRFCNASSLSAVKKEKEKGEYYYSFESFFNRYEKIAFYGAGEIGRELFEFSKNKGFLPDLYIISDGQLEVEKVCGLDVIPIKTFIDKFSYNEWGIIIAGSGIFKNDIISFHRDVYLNWWDTYNDDEYDRFIDYIRYCLS